MTQKASRSKLSLLELRDLVEVFNGAIKGSSSRKGAFRKIADELMIFEISSYGPLEPWNGGKGNVIPDASYSVTNNGHMIIRRKREKLETIENSRLNLLLDEGEDGVCIVVTLD